MENNLMSRNLYQVRVRDLNGDGPAEGGIMYGSRAEAEFALNRVREQIKAEWATPAPEAAYICVYVRGHEGRCICAIPNLTNH